MREELLENLENPIERMDVLWIVLAENEAFALVEIDALHKGVKLMQKVLLLSSNPASNNNKPMELNVCENLNRRQSFYFLTQKLSEFQ
jgi:hypothetical protein